MPDLYEIIPEKEFRNTGKVQFHLIPVFENLKGIDQVEHAPNATSPGPVGNVERPWYMHPNQTDNLVVFHGHRTVELYTPEHGKIVKLEVTPKKIEIDGKVVHEGPSILRWPTQVFHRVSSGPEGSLSVNFAVRTPEFDVRHEFDIYELNTETGDSKVIREGFKDQTEV